MVSASSISRPASLPATRTAIVRGLSCEKGLVITLAKYSETYVNEGGAETHSTTEDLSERHFEWRLDESRMQRKDSREKRKKSRKRRINTSAENFNVCRPRRENDYPHGWGGIAREGHYVTLAILLAASVLASLINPSPPTLSVDEL